MLFHQNMTSYKLRHQELLETILSKPSSPFRETHVIKTITQTLSKHKVPYFLDSDSNIVVGSKDLKSYKKLLSKKSSEPLRVFIAHMDHPGFHGEKWLSPTELEVKWHGLTITHKLVAMRAQESSLPRDRTSVSIPAKAL
jgi:endoglucanase